MFTFQIGYAVVRSLSDYRLGTRHQLNLPGDRDLKVSIGSGEASGPANTWHVVTSQKSETNFREEIRLNSSQINDKIYFLATGNGCSTFEVSIFSCLRLSKVQLLTTCPLNSIACAPRAIRLYINSLLWSGYQMCAPCIMIKNSNCATYKSFIKGC